MSTSARVFLTFSSRGSLSFFLCKSANHCTCGSCISYSQTSACTPVPRGCHYCPQKRRTLSTGHCFFSFSISLASLFSNLTECEFSAVHSFFSKIPPDLPFESLIGKTADLLSTISPSSLLSSVRVELPPTSPVYHYPFGKRRRLAMSFLSRIPIRPRSFVLSLKSRPSLSFLVFFGIAISAYVVLLNPNFRRVIFSRIEKYI